MTEYDVTNIPGTQSRKNMKTMGQVDTSYLMMIITWSIGISFQSPYLNGPVEHIQPHILCYCPLCADCIIHWNRLLNMKVQTLFSTIAFFKDEHKSFWLKHMSIPWLWLSHHVYSISTLMKLALLCPENHFCHAFEIKLKILCMNVEHLQS